jgi:hypothetical protein
MSMPEFLSVARDEVGVPSLTQDIHNNLTLS